MRTFKLGVLFFMSSAFAFATAQIRQEEIRLSCVYRLSVKTAVFPALTSETVGDILFLHGFADESLNHEPYFTALRKAGFRVISFDFPDHGGTQGASLNRTSFRKLTQIAIEIERRTREDENRPLLISGWSTGGLVGYRTQQAWTFPAFDRKVEGLVLFAPGNAVKTLVGKFGFVTVDTLTRNPSPPYVSDPTPISPFAKPLFAGSLLFNSILSRWQGQPKLPILVLLAGEKDHYVKSQVLRQFYEKHDPRYTLIRQYPDSFHGIDAELPAVSEDAIAEAVRFSQAITRGEIETYIKQRKEELRENPS